VLAAFAPVLGLLVQRLVQVLGRTSISSGMFGRSLGLVAFPLFCLFARAPLCYVARR